MQDYTKLANDRTDNVRLYNLDYLRGLAAFGIMIYHYLVWGSGAFAAETFIGRLGVYGVAIFYVLSGLTLYYVYNVKMKPSKEDIVSFFKKRVFRIFPLLWLVTISSILLSGKTPDFTNLFLNLSGLFGFLRWDKYFSPGIWSIGNELVFYVFFPFFILFIKRFPLLMIFLTLFLFGLYLYFAFVILNPDLTLAEQWKNYVNPVNQVFLFLGGFLIGVLFTKVKITNTTLLTLLFFGLGLFVVFPAAGDSINLVSGVNRLVFTFCCFLICFCFFKLNIKLPNFIHKPLTLIRRSELFRISNSPSDWAINGNRYDFLR